MARNFVKLSFKQQCLRRFGEIAVSPIFYALVGGFVLVGAVIGPYGVREQLGFFDRVIFSLQANAVLWLIGIVVAVPVRLAVQRIHPNRIIALLIGCLCAGLAITPVLDFILRMQINEALVFGDYLEYSILFFVLASIITFVMVQISRESAGGPLPDVGSVDQVQEDVAAFDNGLMDKLPLAKRGPVLALLAQDHYVEIVTERGSELVLMRLSDAIALVGDQLGLRVHRSAWVALDAVESVGREQRRAFAVLRNGQKVPVARASESTLSTMLREGDMDAAVFSST
ncbi:LytTR family DNA-binding domain-containing protein [Pseudahrensia aquimaris]|uniref:LytTR family DNA-binding domain-containing protein n=1 Tax=Pseudahrensia aquimaris TaxID=744461 RepID=A0ABW3FDS0_9HYPH